MFDTLYSIKNMSTWCAGLFVSTVPVMETQKQSMLFIYFCISSSFRYLHTHMCVLLISTYQGDGVFRSQKQKMCHKKTMLKVKPEGLGLTSVLIVGLDSRHNV